MGKLADGELVRGVEHVVLLSKVYLSDSPKDDLFLCCSTSRCPLLPFPVVESLAVIWVLGHRREEAGKCGWTLGC